MNSKEFNMTKITELSILRNENTQVIMQKDKELEDLRATLNYIYNSKSWKITKPLRNILRLGKKGKE